MFSFSLRIVSSDHHLSATPRLPATPKSPAGGVLSGGSPSTPTGIVSTPVSDPVVSFVSHQIMELARDCLEKSTEKNLTGAYFNELCIKVSFSSKTPEKNNCDKICKCQ